MYLRLGWNKIIDATYCNSSYLYFSLFEMSSTLISRHYSCFCILLFGFVYPLSNVIVHLKSVSFRVISEDSEVMPEKSLSHCWEALVSSVLKIVLCY